MLPRRRPFLALYAMLALALAWPAGSPAAAEVGAEHQVFLPVTSSLEPYITADQAIILSQGSYFAGEIVNPLSLAICASVTTRTYDAAGGLIEQRFGQYAAIGRIPAGRSTTFESSIGTTNGVAYYEMELVWRLCQIPGEFFDQRVLTVVNQVVSTTEDRGTLVAGTFRNDTGEVIDPTYIEIIAGFYDRRGKVVRSKEALWSSGTVPIGRTMDPGVTLSYVAQSDFDLRDIVVRTSVIAVSRVGTPTPPPVSVAGAPTNTTTTGRRPFEPVQLTDLLP